MADRKLARKDFAGLLRRVVRKMCSGYRSSLAIFVVIVVFGVAAHLILLGPYRFAGGSSQLYAVEDIPTDKPMDPILFDDGCQNKMQWHAIERLSHGRVRPGKPPDCILLSQAPWFVDPNHDRPFGVGRLNILLVVWASQYSNSTGLLSYGYVNDEAPLSLIGRKMRLKYWTKGLNDGSSIHFWVQGARSGRRATNYFLTTPLYAARDGVHEQVLDIGAAVGYRCLGSSWRRIRTYGCDFPPEALLADVNVNFGFIRLTDDALVEGAPGAQFGIISFGIY